MLLNLEDEKVIEQLASPMRIVWHTVVTSPRCKLWLRLRANLFEGECHSKPARA